MLSIVMSDWRRFGKFQLAGLSMWVMILLLVYRELDVFCCPDAPERSFFNLKIFLILIAYGQSPLVLWLQLQKHGLYCRHRMLEPLPFSALRLNLAHLFTAVVFLLLGLIPWYVTIAVWRKFGLPVNPWVLVFVALSIVCFFFISMRNVFPRVLIPILFPVIIVPGVEKVIAPLLEFTATPAASAIAAVCAAVLGWWVLRKAPPRWASEQ